MKREDVLNFLKNQFDAEVKQSSSKRYLKTHVNPDFNFRSASDYIRSDYVVRTEQVIDLSFTETDLERFIDFVAWLDERSDTNPYQTLPSHNQFGIKESPYVQFCIEKFEQDRRERELRKETPALHDAWVQYQAMLALLK
jgi:hypothetical protein